MIKNVNISNWEKPFSVARPTQANEGHYLYPTAVASSQQQIVKKSREVFYSAHDVAAETANQDTRSENTISDAMSQKFLGENVYVT